MDFVDLHVSLREERGKQPNKKLREGGVVPAVVYKKGEDTLSLRISSKDLLKTLHTEAGENVIVRLHVDGAKKRKERMVIIKEVQRDPIRDHLLHVDFQEISLTETLKVKVPIAGKGEAIGVKQDGGVLQHVMWEAEVECLPTNIPEKIEVDVTNIKIGESLYVKDIIAPEGVKILDDPEATVFSVEHPKKVEDLVAAPAEGELQEPEVIKEKKEEPAEEGEAAPEKDEKPAKPAKEDKKE
ncbi:MAG: 50S ribosomal protein L25 [Candidatus Omnitrophica bacterium]|nr:50S ribosomal protein L25 [Candidatus Omnitrophota bacterium]MBU4589687.1 50S ribosomal protein L25 [Candidatus Omnitrophota bacterium]